MMMNTSRAVVLAVLTSCFAVGTAKAQPLADRVPADAVVYVGWAGLDTDASGYAGSRLAKLAGAAELRSKLTGMLAQTLKNRADQMSPDLRDGLELVRSLDMAYLDRPWALYALGKPGSDDVSLRFLIDPGPDRAAIVKVLKVIAQRKSDDPGESKIQLDLGEDADVLSLTVDPQFAPADAGPRLAGSDKLTRAMGEEPAGSLYTVYLNAEPILRSIRRDAHDEKTRAQFDAFGLIHLRSYLATGGFDEQGRYVSRSRVGTDGQPVMILNALAGDPLTDADLRLVPRSAQWMRAIRVDPAGALDRVLAVIEKYDPDAAARIHAGLDRAGQTLGVDLDADLIHGLGDLFALYSDSALGASTLGSNVGLVASLRKPDRVEAVLQAAMGWARDHLPPQAASRVSLETSRVDGATVYSAMTAQGGIGFAVIDGRLYACTQPRSAPIMAKQADAEDSIVDNPAFQRLRGELGVDAPTSLMFADLPATAPGYYYGARMVMQMMSLAMPWPELSQALDLLPPLGQIQDQLGPMASAGRLTPTGWVRRKITPFPGAALLSPEGSTTTVVPLTAGIMLPALGAARRTARQLQCNTQARGIQQACVIYAQSHKDGDNFGHFPPDLATLVQGDYVAVDYLLSPFTDTTAPDGFKQWPEAKQNDWIHKNAAYVLVPGLVEDLDTNKIAVFLKPSASDGVGITVTYNDNSTAWETDLDAIRAKLKKQTGKTMDQLIAEAEAGGGEASDKATS